MIKFIGTLCTALLLMIGIGSPAQAELAVGDRAPKFKLQDQHGKWHALEEYAGKWVALYFYPKDDTPGCTKEACAFRDNIFAFEDIGATILGVSLDDVSSHEAFAEKYKLPFSILSDADATVATDYAVLTKMGSFKFAKRQTFIIDPNGKIAKHYPKVNAEQHSEEVLADLKILMNQAG